MMDKQLAEMLKKGTATGTLNGDELDLLLEKLDLADEELEAIDKFLVDNNIELLFAEDEANDDWLLEDCAEEDIAFAPPQELEAINTALLSSEKIQALGAQLSSQLNSLNLYLKDIAQIDILPIEEENELFQKAAHGDKKAAEKLFYHSQNLVLTVAVNYIEQKAVPFMELVQEANMGLYQALEKYDPNFSFRAQGIWWVKHRLDNYLKGDDLIRIPGNILEDIKKLQEKEAKLREMELSDKELAKELDWDLEYLEEIKNIIRNPQALEDYFDAKEEEERFLAEFGDDWNEENGDEMDYRLDSEWEEVLYDNDDEVDEAKETKGDLLHNMQKRSQARQNQPKHGYYHE